MGVMGGRLPHGKLAGVALVCALVGCNGLFGLDDLVYEGAGGASAATSAGGDGGGVLPCQPQSLQSCYDGTDGTEGVGSCQAGERVCADDGTVYGPCEGQQLPAFDDCVTPADEDCDGSAVACEGDALWSRAFGSGGTQDGTAVAVANDGSLLIAGDFEGQMDFGRAGVLQCVKFIDDMEELGFDLFVAKLDVSGAPVWARDFGAARDITVSGVEASPAGDVYVAGFFRGDITIGTTLLANDGDDRDMFVTKLDGDGVVQWARRFGSPEDDRALGISQGPGGVHITGFFRDDIDFGSGVIEVTSVDNHLFAAQLDDDGHIVALEYFNSGDGASEFTDLAVDAEGNVFVVGSVQSPIDFGGGELGESGVDQAVLLILDADGNHHHSAVFNASSDPATPRDVALGPGGSVAVLGDFRGVMTVGGFQLTSSGANRNMFLARFDPQGAPLAATSFGGAGKITASGLAFDPAGNLFASGWFTEQVSFGAFELDSGGGDDLFVGKFDPALTPLWISAAGGPDGQHFVDLAPDDAGGAYAIGDFRGALTLTGTPLVSVADSRDVVVAHLGP